MQRLHVDRWLCRRAAARTEHIGSSALKLRLPRGNLIRVDVELLGKLRQCPIALDGGKCHLRLKSRCINPPAQYVLLMVSPDSQAIACPLSGRNSTYRTVQISGTGSNPSRAVIRIPVVGSFD